MKEIQLLFLLLIIGIFLFSIERAKRGYVYPLKSLPGIDAISDGIGRAIETGRSVLYLLGRRGVSGTDSAETLAGLGILSHVSKIVAEKGADMIVVASFSEIVAIAQATLKEAYLLAGKPEEYNPSMVYFIPGKGGQWGYHLSVMGMIHRLKPAATFLLGGFKSDALMCVENARKVGSFIISGTGAASIPQMPYFMTHSDYFMMGEEFLATGAYVSNDPVQMGSIGGQDIIRGILIIIAIISIFLGPFGIYPLKFLKGV